MFVCTLEADFAHADVERQGDKWAVTVPIGYDDEQDRSYTLFVILEPEPGGGEHGLSFCIVEANGETGGVHDYWHSADVARFVGREDRAAILTTLLNVVRGLVRTAQPDRIVMTTIDANLPDNALLKYRRIARAVEMCGYAVKQPDPYQGHRLWWMERQPVTGG